MVAISEDVFNAHFLLTIGASEEKKPIGFQRLVGHRLRLFRELHSFSRSTHAGCGRRSGLGAIPPVENKGHASHEGRVVVIQSRSGNASVQHKQE
jgi:hypothetical protein